MVEADLRQPRLLRLSGAGLSRQPEAQRAVGRQGLSRFRIAPRGGRSRARHHPGAVHSGDARGGRRARAQMRAHLCRAVRRGRRCGGSRRAPRRCASCARRRACASRVRTAWDRSRCARSCCSIRRHACARCRWARSAWCSSRAAPSSSGCSRRPRAAWAFPMRSRAATSSISISPTMSISWSRTRARASSPAWSRACAGRTHSWRSPPRRSRPGSRCSS